MSTIASLGVDLTANVAGFKVALDRATQQLDTFGKNTEQTVKKTNSILGSLGDTFGRGSTFTKTLKLLSGGGAILGIGLLTKELEHMAEKAVEVKDAFEKGNMSFGQGALEVAKTLPLLGHLVGFGEQIAELFTGSKAAAAEMAENIKRSNDNAMKLNKTVEIGKNIMLEWRSIAFGGPGSGLGDIFGGVIKKTNEALNPKDQPKFTDLLKQAEAVQKRIDDIRATIPARRTIMVGGIRGNNDAEIQAIANRAADVYAKELEPLLDQIKARRAAQTENLFGAGRAAEKTGERLAGQFADYATKSAKTFWKTFNDMSVTLAGASLVQSATATAKVAAGALVQSVAATVAASSLPDIEAKTRPNFKQPSTVQAAREFRFTEGIPGGGNNPFEKLEKATRDNERALRDNTRELRRSSAGSTIAGNHDVLLSF
jgi:hypothetical protein